jgi:AcrR family transcriptional regulator
VSKTSAESIVARPVRRERGVDAKERILEAAIIAFSERGFYGTTTRDIAAKAGMSPAAIYIHFPSKEDLFTEIAVQGRNELLEVLSSAGAAADSPTQALSEKMYSFTLWFAQNHSRARVVQYDLLHLPADRLNRVIAINLQLNRVMENTIEEGIADGSFQVSDVKNVAHALMTLAADVARWFDEESYGSALTISSLYATLAVRMVGVR